MSINDEDDEQIIIIEPPKEEKALLSSLLSSWEHIVYSEDPQEAKVFLVVSDVYLRNLISKIEAPLLNESQRKHFGQQCIILLQPQIQWITEDGYHRNKDTYRVSIAICHHPYRGLQVTLRLGDLDINSNDTVQAKFTYYNQGEEMNYKTFRMEFHQTEISACSCLIDDKLFDQYFKPKLAIQFTIKKQLSRERSFRGIQNQGNTCYMNSTLQILYFLRPLRKTMIEFEAKTELMRTIKRIFIDLLDVNSQSSYSRSVNASELLSAYGRFPDPRKQQDIHEFLLGFLDQLEGECPQLKEIWIGHGKQILSSRDSEKPYQSSIAQDFNEIDLLLEDHKGNTLGQLSSALHMLLEVQYVDDKIETDQYGKVEVKKTREFINLPNVVFFNLKRYKFHKDRNRPTKILADFQYPPCINLSFLQQTPSGEDQDYILFGVAVHRGQTYNSGHYYSFVNTSSDINRPYWVKFNDSFVTLSSEETALSFKGGKNKHYIWSKEYQRFIEKDYIDEQTAYMLVYVRRDKFIEYQNVQTTIPREWILKRRAEQQRFSSSKTHTIQVMILQQSMDYDLFQDMLPTIPLDLKDDEELFDQLRKLGPEALGCKVASIWKVNRRRKKVKFFSKFIDYKMKPSEIFGYKRGHTIPDYILIVPESIPTKTGFEVENANLKLGIVNTYLKEDARISRQFTVVSKSHLQDHKTEEENRLQKHSYFQDNERFTSGWTDYCTIHFD